MTVVDVGDAFEISFKAKPGATVTMSLYDPDQQPVLVDVAVPESGTVPGEYPKTLVLTSPYIWRAVFTATGADTQVEEEWIRARSVTGQPPPLAVLGEVREQFGNMTAAQEGLTKALIRAASKLIRAQYPSIDQQIVDGVVDGEVAGLAVVAMVLRVLRNPSGLRAEQIGPFSYTYDVSLAAGALIIGPAEESMLTPGNATEASAYAIGTVYTRPWAQPSDWNYPRYT